MYVLTIRIGFDVLDDPAAREAANDFMAMNNIQPQENVEVKLQQIQVNRPPRKVEL